MTEGANDEDDTKLARKLEPLIKSLEETLAQAHDQLLGIRRQLAGGNPIGELMGFYGAHWRGKYGADYVWNRRVDPAQLKRLLNTQSIEDLKARILVYLSTTDPFYERNTHSFGIFVAQVNSFTTRVPPPPGGCKHDPRCRTEVEHTSKQQRDIREIRR